MWPGICCSIARVRYGRAEAQGFQPQMCESPSASDRVLWKHGRLRPSQAARIRAATPMRSPGADVVPPSRKRRLERAGQCPPAEHKSRTESCPRPRPAPCGWVAWERLAAETREERACSPEQRTCGSAAWWSREPAAARLSWIE